MSQVPRVPLAFQPEDRDAARGLVELALAEDLGTAGDLTSRALIPEAMRGTVNVVARADGVFAGSPVARLVFERLDPSVVWTPTRGRGCSRDAGPWWRRSRVR